MNANAVAEDARIAGLLRAEHRKVVAYVNRVIGRSKAEMTAAEAPVRDAPLLDFIAWVQAEVVRKALAGWRMRRCRWCRRRRVFRGPRGCRRGM